jgi:hypothetical protein
MALRQNDWAVGAFCARYCGIVAQHHGLEDDAVQAVDRALVGHLNDPGNYEGIQAAIDFLTDALLSHLSYEEHEIVEPLARLGFYPGQV